MGEQENFIKRLGKLACKGLSRRFLAHMHNEIDALRESLKELKTLARRVESIESGKYSQRLARDERLIKDLERRLSAVDKAGSTKGEGKGGEPSSNAAHKPPPEARALDYFYFEERFRGSEEVIKGRLAKYARYFEGKRNALDIGCGRGEFLEILKGKGIDAYGIDANRDMVLRCNEKSLKAEVADAVEHLEKLSDGSLGGVFMSHVAEHFEPESLARLIRLCHEKIGNGAYFVCETLNPQSIISLISFYLDLTHVKPVHPETMRFLCQWAGFTNADIELINPVPSVDRLKKIGFGRDFKKSELNLKGAIEVLNHNIELLNQRFFGPLEYYVAAKKGF